MSSVFCIGNGESRKDFNLDLLKPHGKIYGCNALYREYTPDVLVSVDHGIMHEIYQSGYCYKNDTWFRDWTTVPDHMYESMVYAGLTKIDIEELNKWHIKNENKRTDEKEFVMHGANLSGLVTILKQNKDKFQKRISQNVLCVSWVKENDKTKNIMDIMPNNRDLGWAAGPTSGYIAVKKENPTKVYLIGHDLNSTTGKVNNLYKGSKYYVIPEHGPTPSVNWVTQWKQLFTQNPHINFYKVNTNMKGEDRVNTKIYEWNEIKNIHYITYENLLDKHLK
ncbi:MAG: Pelagibacter phage [Bacteroidota bacterium]|jgi:hypothetical protein